MMWGPWSQLRYGRDTHDRLGPRALCLRPRRNHEDLRNLLDVPRGREAGDRAAVPDELSYRRSRWLGVRAEAGRGTALSGSIRCGWDEGCWRAGGLARPQAPPQP